MRKFKPNYSVNEIDGLVEYYCERTAFTGKLTWLVRYCDLDQALSNMPPKEYQAVLLIGLLSLPLDHVAKELEVSKSTVWRRYNRGLEWIVKYLNGG